MTYEEAKILSEGQYVTCNTKGVYGITKPGVLCSFLNVHSIDTMVVKVQEGDHKGSIYPVRIELFDPVFKSVKEIAESELFALLK